MSEKTVTIGDRQIDLDIERDGATLRISSADAAEPVSIELLEIRANDAEIRVGAQTYIVPFYAQGTTIWFHFDGETYTADVSDKGSRARARHRDHSASAPMPGIILKILVASGDVVTRGTPLIILEAMKMEHQITAPYDGTVRAINCREGELVQPGIELITLDKALAT